ncbi:MAG: hypothetical protein LAO03_23365 [Acidobacteriia bacterium]|nr:hypothetical protein [Terriglobia bacterium]
MRLRFFAAAILVLAFTTVCGAQNRGVSVDSYIETIRADIRADKIAIITDAMQFSEQDGKAFWPVYRKYEADLVKINDEKVSAIKTYAQKFETLTDADAKTLINQTIDFEIRRAELRKKYASEFQKAGLPALTVAKFLQLEHRLDLVVDLRIASELPSLLIKP